MKKVLTLGVFFDDGLKKETFFSKSKLKDLIERDLLKEKIFPEKVNVVFVGESRMRELNGDFRKEDRVTDVLSFNYDEHAGIKDQEGSWGEVFVCVPYLKRQSKKSHYLWSFLIKEAVVHGILHLAGYDHGQAAAKELMLKKQREWLKELGEEPGKDYIANYGQEV